MNRAMNARLLSASRSLGIGLCLGIGVAPAMALAGPCSDQIAELGKTLSQSPSLGTAPTTGALAGSGPGSAPSSAPADAPTAKGTSADNRMGGTAGTKELNSASSQVATSSQDVRRQQEGLPTAAATAAAKDHGSVETAPGLGQGKSPDDSTAAAKSELQNAVALDRKDDPQCRDSIMRVRGLLKKS